MGEDYVDIYHSDNHMDMDREFFKDQFEGFVRSGWTLDEVFDALDVNGDGILKFEEAGEHLGSYVETPPPEQSAGISYKSFVEKFSRQLNPRHNVADVFNALDRDNDQRLSLDE